MRIGVVGAGAVGGTIAAILHLDGHDVTVTARGAHLEAIRSAGLRVGGAFGEIEARVGAASALSARPDLAFVTTKANSAVEAMRGSAAALAGVPVVVVQNGLGALSSGALALPDSPLVGGLALFAASYVAPGSVFVTAAASIYLGGDDPEAIELARAVLSPVVPTLVSDNFAGAQWTKLVVNQVNALPAITGMSVQEVVGDPGLRRLLTRSMREAVAVARARGIRFAPLQGLSERMLCAFALAPTGLAELLPQAMAARMGAVPNPGSTLQSIRRGQATEVDHLNGAVVAEAEAAGTTAPINAALTALVHEVEAGGRFIPPAEVVARVWLGLRTPQ